MNQRTIRSRAVSVVIGLVAVLCMTSSIPALAAPTIPIPDLDFGSSGPSGPTAPTSRGSRITIAPRANGLPPGTTIAAAVEDYHCASNVNSTGYDIDHCFFYGQEYWARYRFTVTTPDGRVATKVITFDGYTFDNRSRTATEHVEAVCLGGGNIACRSDGPVEACADGCSLTPGVSLGPLPQGPPLTEFCAQEGWTCRAPAGAVVLFGVGGDTSTYVYGTTGDDGTAWCAAPWFGGRDPAVGRLKDCYTTVAPPPPPPPPSRASSIFVEAGTLSSRGTGIASVTVDDGPDRSCVTISPVPALRTFTNTRIDAELAVSPPSTCSDRGATVTFTVRSSQGRPRGAFTATFGRGTATATCLPALPAPDGLPPLQCSNRGTDRVFFGV